MRDELIEGARSLYGRVNHLYSVAIKLFVPISKFAKYCIGKEAAWLREWEDKGVEGLDREYNRIIHVISLSECRKTVCERQCVT